MTGSVLPRGPGVWRLAVDAPRRDDGRRRQVVRYFHGNKPDAQVALAALIIEARQTPTGPTGTVADMLRTWLELADLTPASAQTSREFIDRYLVPRLGGLPLERLTPVAIDRAYRQLLQRGGKGGRPLAPATVQRCHGILTRACSQAVKWGTMPTNPARDATPPSAAPRRHRAPTPQAVRKVLELARATDPEMGTFLALAASTGARRGELCGISWDTIDGSTLWIRRSISVVKRELIEKAPKSGKERGVSLGPATVALLDAHRAMCEARGQATTGYVFSADPNGMDPWLPNTVTQRFIELRNEAGVTFRLHDLRHFAGSQMIGAGVPVTTVARRLGHARPSTTTDLYGTPLDENDARAAETLERILVPPTG